MAFCLVPDFPAVMVALEHLKELEKQLKGEEIPFSSEASLRLTEITAAIPELEAARRSAREHLEVETIENSKLRTQINNLRETISQEIVAEMEQLHKNVTAVSQLQEATVKRRETLLSQNEVLYPEREQVMAEREEMVAAQNDQITFKCGLEMQLDQTRDQLEELKSLIAEVEQDKLTWQQKMVLDREAFTVKKDKLSREMDQVEGEIEQQNQLVMRSRRELFRLNNKKQQTHDHRAEIMIGLAKLESNLKRLVAYRCQGKKQLQRETQKHQEMKQQRETLKKELQDLGEAFNSTIQHLKEEIATVEGEIEEGQASRLVCQDSLPKIYEIYRHRYDEEKEVKAEHFHVWQQLEKSKLQLEERISSLVKHSKEIKEMKEQIRELLEADKITKRVLKKNQKELCENVDTEKKNISLFEEENRRLTTLWEESQRKQEEHVAKMTSDISNTRRRYQEFRQEEATLQERQPKSVNADLLMSHVTQCEVEYRQKETKHREDLVQCAAKYVAITSSQEEKLSELEEKEEILKELKAKWNEEQFKHQRLKTLTFELRRKRSDLEMSIAGLKERTLCLLQPKEEMKAELKEMRESHMDMLGKWASELRAVEISIYDNSVNLEQVSMENSRLHLCIRQMTDDVGRARENKGRYWREVHMYKRDIKALSESLQGAWSEDSLLTRDCQDSDSVLLMSMSCLLDQLETRRQQFGNVSTLLHQQMLDFSKRLGDKAITEQQS